MNIHIFLKAQAKTYSHTAHINPQYIQYITEIAAAILIALYMKSAIGIRHVGLDTGTSSSIAVNNANLDAVYIHKTSIKITTHILIIII